MRGAVDGLVPAEAGTPTADRLPRRAAGNSRPYPVANVPFHWAPGAKAAGLPFWLGWSKTSGFGSTVRTGGVCTLSVLSRTLSVLSPGCPYSRQGACSTGSLFSALVVHWVHYLSGCGCAPRGKGSEEQRSRGECGRGGVAEGTATDRDRTMQLLVATRSGGFRPGHPAY